MNLTEDEIKTVKCLIDDWGWEYGLSADRKKVAKLAEKIGFNSEWVEKYIGVS